MTWLVIGGCAGSAPGGSRPWLADQPGAPRFPSQDTLDALRAQRPPSVSLSMRSRLVDTWTLAGPLPTRAATTPISPASAPASDPWLGALDALARAAGNITLTREMQCTARETARFVSRHGARPANELLNFMASRCGSVAVNVTTSFITRDDDPALADADFLAQWKPMLGQLVAVNRDQRHAAGIWFVRDHGRASMAITTGELNVALDSGPWVPDEHGRVIVRGRFTHPVVDARALITRGAFGVAPCTLHPRVALPAFRVTCRLDRGDRMVWLEMVGFRPDRPVGSSAMRVALWPSRRPDREYRRISYHPPRPAIAEPDLGAGLVAVVNAVRSRAGRDPLTPAPRQTAVAKSLTPYYFDAMFDPDKQALGDTIALGLMAGWKVPEAVDRSWFGATIVGDGDLSSVVSSMLASPFGREVLLGERAHYLAIGTFAQSDSIGAVFSAYSVAVYRDRERARARVLAALSSQRHARGHAAARSMATLQDLADQAARHIERGAPLDQVLTALLADATQAARTQARVWLVTASSLDDIALPDALVSMLDAVVGVGVSVWRKPGAARSHYTIVLTAYAL